MFVMDEADKLIEGIAEDVAFIYNHLPVAKQVLALSATYATRLFEVLKKYMCKPCSIQVHENEFVLKGLLQFYHLIEDHPISNTVAARKQNALWNILNSIIFSQCLIFCNYISRVESVCDWLNNQGFPCTKISSSDDQQSRLKVLEQLKLFQIRVLVTSDLTARGIDATNVNLVINLDLPQTLETYIHRIGRAGCYGSKGCEITFITTGYEEKKFNDFEANGNFVTYPLPDNIPNDLILWAEEDVRKATTSELKKSGEDFEKIQCKSGNLICDYKNDNNIDLLLSNCSSSLESIPDHFPDGCNNNAEVGASKEKDEDVMICYDEVKQEGYISKDELANGIKGLSLSSVSSFKENEWSANGYLSVETNKTKSNSVCELRPLSSSICQVENKPAANAKNYNIVNECKSDVAQHRFYHRKEDNILPVTHISDEQSNVPENKSKVSKKVFNKKEKQKHQKKSLKYQKGSKHHSKHDSPNESDGDSKREKYQPLLNLYYKQLCGKSDETEEICKYGDSSSEGSYESDRHHARYIVSSGCSRKIQHYPLGQRTNFTVPFDWPPIQSSNFEEYDYTNSNQCNRHHQSKKKISRGRHAESRRPCGHYLYPGKHYHFYQHDRKSNFPLSVPTAHCYSRRQRMQQTIRRGYSRLPYPRPSIHHPSPPVCNISNVCEICFYQESVFRGPMSCQEFEDMHCRDQYLHEQFLKSFKKPK